MADEIATVSLKDVQDRSEFTLTDRFDQPYLETKIADAVDFIVDECPTVPKRLASGALTVNNYKRVVAHVVLRVLRNVAGIRNESDSGYAIQVDPNVASGVLWLSDAERRTLNGFKTKSRAIGTVSMRLDPGWSA